MAFTPQDALTIIIVLGNQNTTFSGAMTSIFEGLAYQLFPKQFTDGL
jgi:hypothetical protein